MKAFISYRRVDTSWVAGRIFDRLRSKLNIDEAFMDVESLALGSRVKEALDKAVSECDVLLALIGEDWLTIRDEQGQRRLDNPNDFVRVEIVAALERNIPVIPIVVDATDMPKEEQLPLALRGLANRNALHMRYTSFNQDMGRLETELSGAQKKPDDDRIKVDARIFHGNSEAARKGYFRPGAGKSEWFKDFETAPKMVVVPPGTFLMGSPESEKGDEDEHPQHQVTIAKPFAVGLAPVMRGEFSAFIRETNHKIKPGAYAWDDKSEEWEKDDSKSWLDPGFTQKDDHPVVNVRWHDAKAYVDWLRDRSGGRAYQLLSEAEWEYCCRAGTTSTYTVGNKITANQANFRRKYKGTTSVFKFPSNDFGLQDMHGNVWEWCEDNWHDDYSNHPPTNGSVWRGGKMNFCVLRGGSWCEDAYHVRSAIRAGYDPEIRQGDFGFRVARTL
jgi:formylglycine-generating enzyme required for sulfatase activity